VRPLCWVGSGALVLPMLPCIAAALTCEATTSRAPGRCPQALPAGGLPDQPPRSPSCPAGLGRALSGAALARHVRGDHARAACSRFNNLLRSREHRQNDKSQVSRWVLLGPAVQGEPFIWVGFQNPATLHPRVTGPFLNPSTIVSADWQRERSVPCPVASPGLMNRRVRQPRTHPHRRARIVGTGLISTALPTTRFHMVELGIRSPRSSALRLFPLAAIYPPPACKSVTSPITTTPDKPASSLCGARTPNCPWPLHDKSCWTRSGMVAENCTP